MLIKTVFGGAAIRGANLGLTIVTAVVLARLLSPAEFGTYAFAFAVVRLLSIPSQFGYQVLVVREIALLKDLADWQRIRGLLLQSAVQVFLSSAAIALLILIALSTKYESLTSKEAIVFVYASLLIPMLAFSNLFGTCVRGFGRVISGQLPETLIRPGLFLLFIFVAIQWLRVATPSAESVMLFHVLATMLAVFAGGWMIFSNLSANASLGGKSIQSAEWLRNAAAMGVVAFVYAVNSQADIVILGFLEDAEDVGVYRVSVQGAVLVAFALNVVEVVLAPRLSSLYSSGRSEELRQVFNRGRKVSFVVGAATTIAFVVFGDELLAVVFGPEYAKGHLALAILSVGYLVSTLFGPVLTLLNMTGYEHIVVKVMAMTACLNIVLNLLLIPKLGITGAALATSLSLVAWGGALYFKSLGVFSDATTVESASAEQAK